MSLQKGFLRKQANFKKLGSWTIFTGIFLGLSSAFALYYFSTFLQQIFRLSSIVFSIDLWKLTPEEYNFYNYFFAIFAGIYGLNQIFNFWLNSSRSDVFFKYKYQKVSILTDINSLFWVFILLFSRFALFYGAYFNWDKHFYVINLFPEYNYLFILVLVVLFLQIWPSALKVFGRKIYKLMLLSIISVGVFSILITRLQFINFFEIDQHYLATRFESQYQINLPTLPIFDNPYRNESIQIKMAFPKAEKKENEMPQVFINREKSSFSNIGKDLKEKIIAENKLFPDRSIIIGISIDKNMPVKYVKILINNLRKYGYTRLAFYGYPLNGEIDPRFYLYKISSYNYYPFYCSLLSNVKTDHINDIIIQDNHSPFCLFFERTVFGERLWDGMKLMFLKQSENGDLWLNDKKTNPELFKKQLIWFINKYPQKGIILFEQDPSCTFDQYLKVKALVVEPLIYLRNKCAKENTGKNWEELKDWDNPEEYQELYRDIRFEFPNPILELSPEEKKLFLQIIKQRGVQ